VLPAWAAAAAIAIGVSACGSSAPSSSNSAVAGGSSKVTSAQFQARLDLAKCLRGQGINAPDPTAGTPGYGRVLLGIARTLPQAKLTAAEHSCRQYLLQGFPELALTPAQQAQRLQEEIKFAECMRAHGIDIPDPTSGAPGQGLALVLRSIDRSSPAFKTAKVACVRLRPGRAAKAIAAG
jgi:hypothetical protein